MALARLQLLAGARRAQAGAAEFRRILDNRGQSVLSPLYPLAYLRLARASALTGETNKSRKAYEDFLTLWKDAEQSLPILRQAREKRTLTVVDDQTGSPTYTVDLSRAITGLLEHNSHGIEQELTVFVPVDENGGDPIKLQRLVLRYHDPRAASQRSLELDELSGSLRPDDPLQLALQGRVDGQPCLMGR